MAERLRNIMSNGAVLIGISLFCCVLIGLMAGLLVLYMINADNAFEAFSAMIKNFMFFPQRSLALEYLGSTLVKTTPLLMCTLSVIFAYKTGLFNIGASGQYAAGAGISLYAALAWGMPWYACLLLAAVAGAISGALVGMLKAYRNVNEVIAGIMLNWIFAYGINMLLILVKDPATVYTLSLRTNAPGALLPSLGLGTVFSDNPYVTIAVPLAVLLAVMVHIVMQKTRLGYELRATGINRQAAIYAGMNDRKNIVLTMAISGGLAALGAAFYYLSGIEQWSCAQSQVPQMGFNGVAAAFLGALNPLGAIFSAYLIQHIISGGSYINKLIYCAQISDLITAIIIYVCAFTNPLKSELKEIGNSIFAGQSPEGGGRK